MQQQYAMEITNKLRPFEIKISIYSKFSSLSLFGIKINLYHIQK